MIKNTHDSCGVGTSLDTTLPVYPQGSFMSWIITKANHQEAPEFCSPYATTWVLTLLGF